MEEESVITRWRDHARSGEQLERLVTAVELVLMDHQECDGDTCSHHQSANLDELAHQWAQITGREPGEYVKQW